eukprot:1184233-Prorocentrum_minimum.AAC.5
MALDWEAISDMGGERNLGRLPNILHQAVFQLFGFWHQLFYTSITHVFLMLHNPTAFLPLRALFLAITFQGT